MERPDLRRTDPTDTRSVSRVLRLALVLSVAFAAVLLSLLALASSNNNMFQQHYGLLLWLNIGVAVALAVLAVELARRLAQRFRQGLFGTRLMARLAAAFVLMTVIPVTLIYLMRHLIGSRPAPRRRRCARPGPPRHSGRGRC